VPVASKAQAAWEALNPRQQTYLTVLYDADQAIEAERAEDAANGYYDDTPADVWRWIVVVEGSRLTAVQRRLAVHDVRDEGAGSTLQALQRYGLIEVREDVREGPRGKSKTVLARLTRAGRAAVRAGTKEPGRRRRGELSQYAWKRLVKLWKADPGEVSIWGTTTYQALISRPKSPYAEGKDGRYRITEAGREHYRTFWARYAELYPDIAAPNPDENAADPWPADLDKTLQSLAAAVERARRDRRAAHRHREEALKDAQAPVRVDEKHEQGLEWYELLVRQAQARAELAEHHGARATAAAEAAIRAYAHGVLRAYTASVRNDLFDADLVGAVRAAADAGRDGAQLDAPVKCGLPRVDRAVQTAFSEAMGTRKRRRALPKQMTTRPARYSYTVSEPEPLPREIEGLASLASTVESYIRAGALRRELHPPAAPNPAPGTRAGASAPVA
jgi:DNA-binding PadR family transcriptional regulator